MRAEPGQDPRSGEAASWRSRQRVSAILLTVWFLVTFGIAFFARELDARFLGWPFSFWVAAQGAAGVYLALVVGYAVLMARIDDSEAAPAANPDE